MKPALLHLTAALAGRADQARSVESFLLTQHPALNPLHPRDLPSFKEDPWTADHWSDFEGLDLAVPNSSATVAVMYAGAGLFRTASPFEMFMGARQSGRSMIAHHWWERLAGSPWHNRLWNDARVAQRYEADLPYLCPRSCGGRGW